MSGKYKTRRRSGNRLQAKLSHDLRVAKYEQGLHDHRGGGALPRQQGWGQHRTRKDNITLPNPWRH